MIVNPMVISWEKGEKIFLDLRGFLGGYQVMVIANLEKYSKILEIFAKNTRKLQKK